jgi:hypothetical protein
MKGSGNGSGNGSGSVPLTKKSGSGRPKKHADPADPDPQHYWWVFQTTVSEEELNDCCLDIMEAIDIDGDGEITR